MKMAFLELSFSLVANGKDSGMFFKLGHLLFVTSFLGSVWSFDEAQEILELVRFDFESGGNKIVEDEFYSALRIEDPQEIRAKHFERILKFANRSVDPCDNFYEYACGNYKGYADRTTFSDERYLAFAVNVRLLQNLLKQEGSNSKAKQLYDFCTAIGEYEGDRLDAIPKMLDEFVHGGKFDWVKAVVHFGNGGMKALLKTTWERHGRQISVKTRKGFAAGVAKPEAIQMISKYVTILFDTTPEFAVQAVSDMYDFEVELRKTFALFNESDKETMKVADLDNVYPNLRLREFLSSPLLQRYPISEIIVVGVQAMKSLDELISKTSPEKMYSYLLFETILALFKIKIHHKEVGEESMQNYACAAFVEKFLAHESALLFAKEFVPEKAMEQARDIAEKQRAEIRKMFVESDLLDASTRDEAIKKVDNMKIMVGVPDTVFDEEFMANQSNHIEINQNSTFKTFFSIMYRKFLNNQQAAASGPNFDRISLIFSFRDPLKTSAVNSRELGGIGVILGLLSYPFFNKNFPNFHKYGVVGSSTGHELMHAFDVNSIGYDSEFNPRSWVSPDVEEKRLKQLECWYNDYKRDLTMDPAVTIGENIPDSLGLQVAFRAYKTWAESVDNVDEIELDGYSELGLNKYQMFFLSKAQADCNTATESGPFHASSRDRVVASMANSKHFAEAFNCPVGSPMNPEKKCRYFV